MRRLWIFFVVMGLLLVGCSLMEKFQKMDFSREGQAVLAFREKPDRLIPYFPCNRAAFEVEGLLFRGFTRRDDFWTLQPVYCRSIPGAYIRSPIRISYRKSQVKFRLLPRARWSDGTLITTQDFIFAFQVAVAPFLASNREEWVSYLDGIKAPSRDTLILRWKNLYCGAGEEFVPLPRESLGGPNLSGPMAFMERGLDSAMVVNGPFAPKKFRGNELVLVANANYVPAKPELSGIVVRWFPKQKDFFRALGEKKIDAVPYLSFKEGLIISREYPDYSVYFTPSNRMRVILLNHFFPPFRDRAARRALFLALDRGEILRDFYPEKVEVAQSWLPAQHPAYTPCLEDLGYDFTKAQKELIKGGWKIGSTGFAMEKKGQTLSFKIGYLKGDMPSEAAAAHCREYWKKIAVEAEPEGLPEGKFKTALRSKFYKGVLICIMTVSPSLSPTVFFGRSQIPSARSPGRGANLSGWSNPENEKICAAFDASTRDDERRELLKKQQAIFAREVPLIPLCADLDVSACRKGFLNWKPRGFGEITWNAEEWSWYK